MSWLAWLCLMFLAWVAWNGVNAFRALTNSKVKCGEYCWAYDRIPDVMLAAMLVLLYKVIEEGTRP